MKRIISRILSVIMVLMVMPKIYVCADEGEISVVLNGQKLYFYDVNPMIIENRTMVPMRAIFDYLGMEVEWDQSTLTAKAHNEKYIVRIGVEENYIYSNDTAYFCDVPPLVVEGRILLPLRILGKAVDADVRWEQESLTAYIDTLQYINPTPAQTSDKEKPQRAQRPAKTPAPDDDEIVINPSEAVLNIGETKTVKASIKNMRDETYTWSSSNNDVARVNEKGVVTAISQGEAYITARGDMSGLWNECRIRVVYDYDTRINLGSNKMVLVPGEIDCISWSVSGKKKEKCKMSFKSDNKDVATVNNQGWVTAKGTGTALITITDTESKAKRVCIIKVKATDPPVTEVSVSALGANPSDRTSYSGYTTTHNPGTPPGFFLHNKSGLPITVEGEAKLITPSYEETIYLCRVSVSSDKITKLKKTEIGAANQSLIQFSKYDEENDRFDGFKMERTDKTELTLVYANTRYKLEITGDGGYTACILAE